MDQAIRMTNGNPVSKGVYRGIRASVIDIVTSNFTGLQMPKNHKASKTLLKEHYPGKWAAAVAECERTEPLLALCASHWKAEHLMAQIIRDPRTDLHKPASSRQKPASSRSNPSDESDADKSATSDSPDVPEDPAAGKRRRRTHQLEAPKKKHKSNGGDAVQTSESSQHFNI